MQLESSYEKNASGAGMLCLRGWSFLLQSAWFRHQRVIQRILPTDTGH
jgi:hypothetical protein